MKRLPLLALILVLLGGLGISQTKQHNITLYWNPAVAASGDPNAIASYNVMRGTVSGGPYSLLGNVPASATQVPCLGGLTGNCFSFVDSSGTGGTTYDYVVVTVDSAGFSSVNSPQASAMAVANPTPPAQAAAVSN
jgi:hypothetical protein